MTLYQKLIERKRKWTPVQMTAGKLKEGAEEAVFRALALRQLELPVGEFIADALNNEVPTEARKLLTMNVTDEENHDLALSYAAKAHGTNDKAEAEAGNLDKLGKAIQTTPYSKQWYLRELSSLYSSRSSASVAMLV